MPTRTLSPDIFTIVIDDGITQPDAAGIPSWKERASQTSVYV